VIQDRWCTFTLAQQLGNIASELSRARYWEDSKDSDNKNKSLKRSLELLDFTLKDNRWKGHRLREFTRLKEVICDWINGNTYYNISGIELEEYCMHYALLIKK